MLITKYLALVACAALVGSLRGTGSVRAFTQERESLRPDLSGRWQLNRELSENAQAKLDRMQSSQGHGPGRHGFGGLFGRLFGGGDMQEARGLILNAPSSFTLTQDGDRIVLTGSDGRVRTLTANGRKQKVNGRDVQTKWDNQRLVSEIEVGDAKVTEAYERSTNAPTLIVTSRMAMRGHDVSGRRVYDAETARRFASSSDEFFGGIAGPLARLRRFAQFAMALPFLGFTPVTFRYGSETTEKRPTPTLRSSSGRSACHAAGRRSPHVQRFFRFARNTHPRCIHDRGRGQRRLCAVACH